MQNHPSPSAAEQPRIDARALLGLTDGSDRDWGPIRAAQLAAQAALAPVSLLIHVAGSLLVAAILAAGVPLWIACGWAVVICTLAVMLFARRQRRRRETDWESASLIELQHTRTEAIALAVAWSIAPLAVVALGGSHGLVLGLWIVNATVMTACAVCLAALPLPTIVMVALLGLSSTLAMAIGGAYVAAASTPVLTGLLIVDTFQRARALVMIRDRELAITERDETVRLLLREFEEDTSADWLWEIDGGRRIVGANARFAAAVGSSVLELNGKPLLQVLAGEAWEQGNFAAGLRQLADKLKTRESFRDVLLPVVVGDEDRWWELSASPRFDERGTFVGFRGVGSDVTEARRSADKINRMARFDTLTGLPNRLLINESMARAMREAEKWSGRCGFFMIDLDRFKAVNDTLGHPVGDRLLQRVAERLRQVMTENEVVGRLGGDEFAVVVRDASDSERVERLARTIIETISRPYEVDNHTLYIGASVGVAVGPRDGRTAEMLIRSADLALYRSKDAGGGAFHAYEPQLHSQAEERRVLEIALRKALVNGEMFLHYQPVVSADEGRLTGFEALIRWRHPEHGIISPVKFIPLAEDARLIAPIGEWVLRTACAEAAQWTSDARVAVNVSPEQLYDPGFVTVVLSALSQSGLSPHRLELEVTESVFMREGTSAVQVLEQLIDLGIRLSLDDFGTGYSSLGYLSRTRFSTIKIDRSFVQAASQEVPEALAIIRAVVAMAQSLGMATTAEGVETAEEHAMVHALGCTKVQGFYFGRPLPVEEARALACPNVPRPTDLDYDHSAAA